jgi:hypothetical protein
MKNRKAWAPLLAKCWPFTHRWYRESCILASTGQLGGPEMCELNDHIARCKSCRRFLELTARASVGAVSLLADARVLASDIVPPEGMRARFLARMAPKMAGEERLVASDDPAFYSIAEIPPDIADIENPEDRACSNVPVQSDRPRGWFAGYPAFARAAAVLAVVVMTASVAYLGGRRTASSQASGEARGTSQPSAQPAAQSSSSGGVDFSRLAELERTKSDLEAQKSELAEKLSGAAADKKSVEDHLADSLSQLSALTAQERSEQQRANQDGQDARVRIASLQEIVDKLRWQLGASEAKFSAQEKQDEDLRAKLDEAETDLQREMATKSGPQSVGSILAERNLHIIDVYDVDKGKRQPSFGRVFYVEGKSLAFYVYDLEDPRRLSTNVVFRVWGEKTGVKETTHSLGILHNDDTSQGCWTLSFDDPKVLTQINSVFVTAEVANRRGDQPRGKKVLYAYFGSKPNHP